MENLKASFKTLSGKFMGRGVNHEGQTFTGILEAKPVKGNLGVALEFQAIGDDGAVYHAESSLLGHNLHGKPGLWVLSSNHPGIFERALRHSDSTENGFMWIFGFGDKNDCNSFREEIRLEYLPRCSVRYVYSWGMPGGEFAERSGVLMKLI